MNKTTTNVGSRDFAGNSYDLGGTYLYAAPFSPSDNLWPTIPITTPYTPPSEDLASQIREAIKKLDRKKKGDGDSIKEILYKLEMLEQIVKTLCEKVEGLEKMLQAKEAFEELLEKIKTEKGSNKK